MIQAVLEERIGTSSAGASLEPFAGASALLVVHFMNEGLPKRFHKSEIQIIMEMDYYRRLTKRELLKTARSAWVKLGSPKPRGWTMPPYRRTLAAMECLSIDCANLLQEIKAGKLVNEQALAARILEIQR